jgi:DNA-binding CsgD family transcriptional regulator
LFAQSLHPHLIRAFRLGEKFHDVFVLGECQDAVLDRMSQGVVIVDAKSRIYRANVAAEGLMRAPNGIDVIDGRLTATQPIAAQQLDALIGAAARSDSRRGGSMKVAVGEGHSLSVTVVPLAARALPIFTAGPFALVTIHDARADEKNVRKKLEELFALTPAEVRVAAALLAGATPSGAARLFDVSVNTIRSQRASIFGKTGTTGQAGLSRLMLRLTTQP